MKPKPEPPETLARILASPAFRNSRQCQRFLSFVVEHTLNGDEEMLKERSIGVEVFGRAPDYDTAGDPVVRVRATEVRKRLAQYYGEFAVADDVRIEMPSGSYRVEVHPPAAPPVAGPDAARAAAPRTAARRFRPALLLAGVLAIAVAAIGVAVWRGTRAAPPATVVEDFWRPVLDSTQPVLIYCGQPVVYFLSREVHERYRGQVPPAERRGAYALSLPPDAVIRGRDIVPVTGQFVGIGNAHTAALLSGYFAARRKPVEIRYANDLSFTDLRNAPSVLIGAFSNLWTLDMTGQLRFVFEQENGVRRIRDRSNSRTWQLGALAPDGRTPDDYAVVSRIFDSATGRLLIAAAGITQYGTRAAGELLTDPARLQDALSQAPPDWRKKNLQVLLHTSVFKSAPGPPKPLAVHTW